MKRLLSSIIIVFSASCLFAQTPSISNEITEKKLQARDYRAGKIENGERRADFFNVTISQYCDFLNAVASSDPQHLYDEWMTSNSKKACIVRAGLPDNYTYSVINGKEELPMTNVSWFDEVRYFNWLENGQPIGSEGPQTTEEGLSDKTNCIVTTITPHLLMDSATVEEGEKILEKALEFSERKTIVSEGMQSSTQIVTSSTINHSQSEVNVPLITRETDIINCSKYFNPTADQETNEIDGPLPLIPLGRGNSSSYIDSAAFFDVTGGRLIQSTPSEEKAREAIDETETYATTARIRKDETFIRQEIARKEEYLKTVVAQRDQAKSQANSLPKDSPQQIEAKNLWKKLSKDVKKARDSHRYAQNALNSILANDQSDDEPRTTNESDDTTATLSDEEDRTFMVVLKKGVKQSVKQEMLNTYGPYLQEVRHSTSRVSQLKNDSSKIMQADSGEEAIQKFAEETKVEQKPSEGFTLKPSISSLSLEPTVLSMSQRADEALKRSQIASTKALEAEHEGNQEIANMWHVASKNLQLVAKHWNNANKDYAIAVEQEVSDLEKYIASFIASDKEHISLPYKTSDLEAPITNSPSSFSNTIIDKTDIIDKLNSEEEKVVYAMQNKAYKTAKEAITLYYKLLNSVDNIEEDNLVNIVQTVQKLWTENKNFCIENRDGPQNSDR